MWFKFQARDGNGFKLAGQAHDGAFVLNDVISFIP